MSKLKFENNNLEHMVSVLNKFFFKDNPVVLKGGIFWSKKIKMREWGHYNTRKERIEINRALRGAPLNMIGYVVFHEMVHHIVPVERGRNGRFIIHGQKFKRIESKYPYFNEFRRWEKSDDSPLVKIAKEKRNNGVKEHKGFRVGDNVRILGTSTLATIESFDLRKHKYPVYLSLPGGKRTRCSVLSLEKTANKKEKKIKKEKKSKNKENKKSKRTSKNIEFKLSRFRLFKIGQKVAGMTVLSFNPQDISRQIVLRKGDREVYMSYSELLSLSRRHS